jgi:hypothetical protein
MSLFRRLKNALFSRENSEKASDSDESEGPRRDFKRKRFSIESLEKEVDSFAN